MQIASRLPWSALGAGALLEAHVRGALPADLRLPGLAGMAALAGRPRIAPGLLSALRASAGAAMAPRFDALADARALAVVTGQQPGCAGGAFLVLLKAATAVALARRATRTLARPVVPVFWNAADDVDFDEVARVGWPTADGELLFLELPARDRRAQGFVGDLPAMGDTAAAATALALLDAGGSGPLAAWLPQAARDHGDWVTQLLGAVFPDLVVVDARWPALREHAAPLFARYLDIATAATGAIEARAARLADAGYARTLSPASAQQGLFLVAGGQRRKINDDLTPLRRAVETAPATVAPNVVLRPLVQDALLPVVASVVGPAEIGYLHEIHGLRADLGVPEVALVPRLGMTLVDAATWDAAARHGIAPAALLAGGDAPLQAAARQRAAPAVQRAEAAFATATATLTELTAPTEAAPLQRPLRRLATLRDEFVRGLEAAALAELLRSEPALQRVSQRLRPRGKAQERVWAALWLLGRWGPAAGATLLRLAEAHLDAVADGEAAHWLLVD